MALGSGALALTLTSAPVAYAMGQDNTVQASSQASRPDAQIQSDVLKQLATAPGITGQKITANTSNGVVTLTGSVTDEVTSQLVQNAVSGVPGVKTVQNNLTIGGIAPAPADAPDNTTAENSAPAPADQAQAQQPPANTPPAANSTNNNNGWGPAGPPPDAVNGQVPPPPANNPQPQVGTTYGAPAAGSYPAYPGYPSGQYPNGQAPMRPQYQAQPYQQSYQQAPAQAPPMQYVQPKGPVTIPPGALLTVRLENSIDARHLQVGDTFITNVSRDVFQDGILALPRGATLEGKVIGFKKPGNFAGGGYIQLQLTQLDLDGHTYPLVSDVFSTETPGKGGQSAANTIGGAAFGAILGAAIGGGPGAAVGAVAGGAGGAALSTATPGPRAFIPAEAMITFHLKDPLTLQPVSYEEATRLAATMPNPHPALLPRRAYLPPPPGYYPY